jgi:hypothetical protein
MLQAYQCFGNKVSMFSASRIDVEQPSQQQQFVDDAGQPPARSS